MIFRRIKAHIEKENWFAVFIDFCIVVIGVFIGIQVANWNADQEQSRQLDIQLSAYADELVANLDRLETYADTMTGKIDSINAVRTALSGDLKAVDSDAMNLHLLNIVGISNFRPEMVAYNDLADSGALTRLAGTPLRQAISDWETELKTLRRLDQDALTHRDEILLPFFAENASISAMLSSVPRWGEQGFTQSRFSNDLKALAGSPGFDNVLAIRFGTRVRSVQVSDDLKERINVVLSALQADGNAP